MPGPVFALGDLDYIAKLNDLSNGLFTYSKQVGNFAAVKGFEYWLDASDLVVTLPLAPAAGDRMLVRSTKASVVKVTFGRNGQNINASANDLIVLGTSATIHLLVEFVDATQGWRIEPLTRQWGGVKSANFTAVRNTDYGLNANDLAVTLPATPQPFESVRLASCGATVKGAVLGRNGSNINSAAADVTVNVFGAVIVATYMDATIGWALSFESGILPGPRVEATDYLLKYYNTQRELADHGGYAPFAFPLGGRATDNPNTTAALAAAGGTALVPIIVETHMLVQSLTIRNADTTLLREIEFRLYRQRLNNGNSSENTLDEVPNSNGTDSFTASISATTRTINFASPGFYLSPGVYWLAVRNSHATNTWGFVNIAPGANMTLSGYQTKTVGALGTTLDAVLATWTKVAGIAAVRLNGRVFGQTAGF